VSTAWAAAIECCSCFTIVGQVWTRSTLLRK